VGAQLLSRHRSGICVNQDEGEDAGDWPVVDPGMHRAALDDDIAGLQMCDLTAVQLEGTSEQGAGVRMRVMEIFSAGNGMGWLGRFG
jgi:hypothetical protein